MDSGDANGRVARFERPGGWRSVAERVVSASGPALRTAGLVARIEPPGSTRAGTVSGISLEDPEGRTCALRVALVLADATTDGVEAEDGVLFGVVFLDVQRSVPLADGWRAVSDAPSTALGIFVDDLVPSLSRTLSDAIAHYGLPVVAETSSCERTVRHDLAVPLAKALLEAVPEAVLVGSVSPEGPGLVMSVEDGGPNVLSLRDDGVAWIRDGAQARFMPASGPWGMTLSERVGWLAEEILDRSGSKAGNVRTP